MERLPEYKDSMAVDYDYEEQVRGTYRPSSTDGTHDRNTYDYQQDSSLYDLNDQNHQTFKLYQERLIANKTRVKTGKLLLASISKRKQRGLLCRLKKSESLLRE